MNTTEKSIETLFHKVEDYGKTSIELLKLNTIDKTADLVASLLSQVMILVVGMAFILFSSIGVAFWLGAYFASNAIGFFIVGGFYLLLTVLFFLIKKSMKAPIRQIILSNITAQKN